MPSGLVQIIPTAIVFEYAGGRTRNIGDVNLGIFKGAVGGVFQALNY